MRQSLRMCDRHAKHDHRESLMQQGGPNRDGEDERRNSDGRLPCYEGCESDGAAAHASGRCGEQSVNPLRHRKAKQGVGDQAMLELHGQKIIDEIAPERSQKRQLIERGKRRPSVSGQLL